MKDFLLFLRKFLYGEFEVFKRFQNRNAKFLKVSCLIYAHVMLILGLHFFGTMFALYAGEIINYATEVVSYAICFILADISVRFSRVFYEYIVMTRHYTKKNRVKTIFRYAFHFNNSAKFSMLMAFTILCIGRTYFEMFPLNDLLKRFLLLTPAYFFFKSIWFSYSYLELADFVRLNTGLDYAQGMAHSYYFGYLHFILPEKEDGSDSLKKRIDEYSSTECGPYFPVKRLFILIPDSLHVPPTIGKESPLLERCEVPLKFMVKNRAGVQRPYSTAVYKIKGCNWYVCLEGATPLVSYYDAKKHSSSPSELRLMEREILIKFYQSLKQILNANPETKNLCELVIYNETTAEGHPTDVGEIILAKINEMRATGTAAY